MQITRKRIFKIVWLLLICVLFLFTLASCSEEKNVEYKITFKVDEKIYHHLKTDGKNPISFPKEPTKKNYYFIGWYLDKDKWTEELTMDYIITKSIIVYAKWEEEIQKSEYIITYDYQGATENNIDLTYIVTYDSEYILVVPIKENNVFAGWYDQSDKQYTDEFGVSIEKWTDKVNKTLYAKWVEYTIGLNYTLIDEGYSVSAGNVIEATMIIIPEVYNGLPVTEIDSWAFSGCLNLKKIIIPKSIIIINQSAFQGCSSLESITISESVMIIAETVFIDCINLKSINVDEKNEYYSSINDVLFNKEQSILLQYPAGKAATSYIIPQGITSIGNGAFYNCWNLMSITIPSTVERIGIYAFINCVSLENLIIPEAVTSIGDFAFYNCFSLEVIIIPNGVINLGISVFYGFTSTQTIYITGRSEEPSEWSSYWNFNCFATILWNQ